MAMWYDNIDHSKVSKTDILEWLINEMKMQKKVFTGSIRKGKMTEKGAIKKAACCKAAYYIIKNLNEKENGVQKQLF